MIFFDFEVFKDDWLVVFVDMTNQTESVIVNDPAELAGFYILNSDQIFTGYNVRNYDQYILKGILAGFNPKEINDFIIVEDRCGWEFSKLFREFPLTIYDCFQNVDRGLKYFEGSMGNDIRETGVPFDIDRKLTADEIAETVKYCRHDVEQTVEVFLHRKDDFTAQMQLLKMFELPLSDIGKTKPQLSAKILKASKRNHNDEFDINVPDTLEITRYRNVVDWYLDPANHKYRVDPNNEKSNKHRLKTNVAGVPHVFGWGGVHGAIEQYHERGYFINMDVASLYPSLIIRYGLMSRNVSDPSKYKEIRDLRIKLKAEHDPRQAALKLVLNSTYGAMKDKYNPLFDPRQANLVCVYGQLLLVDLMEHLENIGAEIIQSNTDGVLVRKPKDGTTDAYFFDRVDDVAAEWEQRTGLTLEFDEYTEVFQKDVNGYVFVCPDGSFKSKGEWVKKQDALSRDLPIVNRALVEYMVHRVPVKQTVNECDSLADFQKVARLSSKYRSFVYNGKPVSGKTCRVFASNDRRDGGLCKIKSGCMDRVEKVASTPERCHVMNDSVVGVKASACPWLNRDWYVQTANERLHKFGL